MKIHKTIKHLLLVLFFLLITFALSAQEDIDLNKAEELFYNAGFGVLKETTPAPDFTIETLQGDRVSLSDYRGEVVLLNLWATWCPPCREEMPSMQSIYDQLKDRGFTILAVAAPNPPRETFEKIENYVSENEYTFPVLIDSEYKVYGTYGTGSIPTSWVVDTEGNLVSRLVGATDWESESIMRAFEELLP
ncbi:MAG TPA: TlpA disulfide reductase family protein [Clostridia bacterium]|nr:TlpA disulfide reductase family protein [Clostridia bacterium]